MCYNIPQTKELTMDCLKECFSCCSSCFNHLPTYTYRYFNEENNLVTCELNIFQYYLRRWFGFYSETHRDNVIKKFYENTLMNPTTLLISLESTQALFALVEKSHKVFDFNFKMKDGGEIIIRPQYVLNKDDNDFFYIQRLNLSVVDPKEEGLSHDFVVQLNKKKQLDITLPALVFHTTPDDTVESIVDRFNEPMVGILNQVVLAILFGSTTPLLMTSLPAYRNKQGTVDGQYALHMQKLGWKFTGIHQDPKMLENSGYLRQYFAMNRDPTYVNARDFPPNRRISLDFAATYLKPNKHL